MVTIPCRPLIRLGDDVIFLEITMRNLGAAALWTALGAGGIMLALGSLATSLGSAAGPTTAARPEQVESITSAPRPQEGTESYDSELLDSVVKRTTGQLTVNSIGSERRPMSIEAVLEEAEEFDEADLEQLRGQFTSLTESMKALDPTLPIDLESIELAEYDELSYARASFFDYTTFSSAVDALALVVEDPVLADAAYALLEEDPWKYNGRIQDAVLDAAAIRGPYIFPTAIPNFTPLIPSPEPATPQPLPNTDKRNEVTMNPTPGIDADWPSDTVEGLWPPKYPDDIPACINLGVTTARSDEVVGLLLRILNGGLDAADGILNAICKLEVEAFGNSANVGRCIAWWLTATLKVLPAFFQQVLDRCDGAIDSAEIQAAYQNTQRILARLKNHEALMRDAMYTSDLYLRDIEAFQERMWIEDNLASADDNADVLLMLPASTCRPLPGSPTRLYPPDGPIRRRCGKILEVKRIVEQTISMVEESGESINNALAEYEAAILHLNAGSYRDAFTRFRKAYREAVSTRGPR